jgi:hypothetical protein
MPMPMPMPIMVTRGAEHNASREWREEKCANHREAAHPGHGEQRADARDTSCAVTRGRGMANITGLGRAVLAIRVRRWTQVDGSDNSPVGSS